MKAKMTKAQVDFLVERFMVGQFKKGQERSNPRMDKSETLFALAQEAQGGAIVELGTYLGNGAICLYWGTSKGHHCPVHTVDPFEDTTGWIGEQYQARNFDIFLDNITRARVKVTHWRLPSQELAQTWNEPIALLFWDITGVGVEQARENLRLDFFAWSKFIIPGGRYVVHEPGPHRFGGDRLIQEALQSGLWEQPVQWGGYIWSLERKK